MHSCQSSPMNYSLLLAYGNLLLNALSENASIFALVTDLYPHHLILFHAPIKTMPLPTLQDLPEEYRETVNISEVLPPQPSDLYGQP